MATTARGAPAIDIIRAIKDPGLLDDVLSPAQESALRLMYGLPLDPDQAALVAQCTERPPEMREYREGVFICGRRAGKSDKLCANIVVYESLFRPHRLSPGEQGVALLLAQNMRQAQVVAGYVRAKLEKSPILRQHVIATRALEIDLDNGVTIAVHPASFRAVRGLSVICAVLDEACFWWTETESANPDVEIVRAIRPSMATHPNAKLIIASSPYAKTGLVYDLWCKRHEDTEVLVWRAPTALMNPTVEASFLAREQRRDPESYVREYEAEFVDSVSGYLSSDAIEGCTVRGRLSMPYSDRFAYCCAIDAAFKGDKFALAVAHRDHTSGKVIIDRLEAWEGSRQAPLALAQVLPSIKAIAAQYRLHRVVADQFAVEPLRHALAQIGLTLEEQTFSAPFKADMYSSLRSLLTDGRIELLDHPQSLKELRSLEVEALPGGGSRIGHPRRAHASDDFADVIALSALEAIRGNGSRPFDPEGIVAGDRSIWASDPLGASADHDYGLRRGEQIVGRMNDRGQFEKLGGW